MEKKTNSDKIIRAIFSTNGLLVAIVLLMGYWIFFGNNKEEKAVYQASKNTVGIGNAVNQQVLNDFNVDLTEHLDPKLVPPLVAEAMKETASAGVKEAEFIQAFVGKVSNKIQGISTIDLNNDGIPDPILVIPQSLEDGTEHIQLSVRVPDPDEVKEMPSSGDMETWRKIADKSSIEVMNVAAIKENSEKMVMQAAPNSQLYHYSGHPPYYHHHIGFSDILLTSMMVHWMFTPSYYSPFYSPFHFGGYAPQTTTVIRQNRTLANNKANSVTTSTSAAKTASGKTIANNKFRKVQPKTMNQIKTTQFNKKKSARTTRSGGFGKSKRTTSAEKSRTTTRKPTYRKPRTSSRSIFGSKRRSSFGRRRR